MMAAARTAFVSGDLLPLNVSSSASIPTPAKTQEAEGLSCTLRASGCIVCNEKTSDTEKHVPSESFWPYLNITALQEQFFKQDCLQSSLFVAFRMVWLTSKYETSVRAKS
uniref:Uncharacterized protein n=1 Tax=Oryza nivara TaxID=4536 RepID=A0A0E0GYS9_ORYNI